MTKQMWALWIFFTLFSATASALQCYDNTQFTCGDHEPAYDAICEQYEKAVSNPSEVSCPDKCGTVTVTQSYQGLFEINLVLSSCMASTNGCLDKDELEEASPELSQQIKDLESTGITTERLTACTCGTNLCNSAANLAGRSVYLLTIIIAAIKVILLG